MANDWVFLRASEGTVTAEPSGSSGTNEMPEEIARIDAVHRTANGLQSIARAITDVAMAIEALASAQSGRSLRD